MRHRTTRTIAPLAAAAATLGLAGAAGAQQGYRPQQDRPSQPGPQQREMRRQMQGQQDLDPERIDTGMLVVIGMDLDNDGSADVTYIVPGSAIRQFAREHRDERMRAGMGGTRTAGMQLRPWRELRQSGQAEFEDLPLDTGEAAAQTARLRGTVDETRTARLLGQPEPSALAKVRLPDGGVVFADLGPASGMREQNVRLSRGDEVSIVGTPALINNRPVIFAEELRTDEGVIPIDRSMARAPLHAEQFGSSEGRQDRGGRPGQEQPRLERASTGEAQRLSGTIIEKDAVRIGSSEPYEFCKIRTDDGQTHWVSLGPRSRLEGLSLNENDRIAVVATPVPLVGDTIFYAKQVRADGQTLAIEQESGRSARLQQTGMGQRLQELRGTVEEKQEVSIGDSAPYVFVELHGDDGKMRWVNLGPRDQIEDLGISENDRLEVLARETDLHGQPVFHAQQLRTDRGGTITIQQTGSRAR